MSHKLLFIVQPSLLVNHKNYPFWTGKKQIDELIKYRFFVEKKPLESAFIGYNINNLVITGDILQGILTKNDNIVFSDEETEEIWLNVNEWGPDTWMESDIIALEGHELTGTGFTAVVEFDLELLVLIPQ